MNVFHGQHFGHRTRGHVSTSSKEYLEKTSLKEIPGTTLSSVTKTTNTQSKTNMFTYTITYIYNLSWVGHIKI